MTATTAANRVATYFDQPRTQPPPPLPPLPTTPEGRQAVLADVLCAALLTLRAELADADLWVRHKAAVEILDFEKTRLRHGRDVIGTTPPPPDLECVLLAPRADPEHPLAERAEHTPDDDDEPEVGPTADEMEAAELAGREPDADDELADIDVPPIVPARDRAAYREYVQDVREVLTVAYNQSGLKRVVSLGDAAAVAREAVCLRFQGQCEERPRPRAEVC